MRIFKSGWFERFAGKQRIDDATLREAIVRAERGQIDADLGGGVVKQRIARPGQGRSGGFRSIILFRTGERAFFVFGFAKSDRDNIDREELDAFRKMAHHVLALTDDQLARLLASGQFMEIGNDDGEV